MKVIFEFVPLFVFGFIAMEFIEGRTKNKIDYTIKMNNRVIEVEHCEAKDGVIVYKKKDGKTKRMIESRNVKCIKTER